MVWNRSTAIDQTTPGTTNGVVVKDTAGTAVGVDADGGLKIHVQNPTLAYGTAQTPIARRGAISINSGVDTLLQNSTGVPAGYAAQAIDYTVTAGKNFYLNELHVALDGPPGGAVVMVTIALAGVKSIYVPVTDIIPMFAVNFRGRKLAAGQAFQVYARRSGVGVAVLVSVTFGGVEE